MLSKTMAKAMDFVILIEFYTVSVTICTVLCRTHKLGFVSTFYFVSA